VQTDLSAKIARGASKTEKIRWSVPERIQSNKLKESIVTRTETVYVTANGTRVRRVVTVDESGRRYYVDDGRTVYVNHYEY
jgi:hypothetical protein